MEIRQLRYFVAAVDARSITRAAHQLHLVQSALSHQIANLEQELNAPLLVRSRSGVVPTEAGLLLYRHAQAALKNVEAARQAIFTVGNDVRGAVKIGLPNSTVPLLALPLLRAIRKELPNVEISIYEGLSAIHADMLFDGKLDLAILFESIAPRGMEISAIFSETMHFLTADVDAVARYSKLDAIDLLEVARWPLLLPPPPNGIRVILERECFRANLRLQVAANLSGVQTISNAVVAGLGSTVMMAANVKSPRRKSVLLLPIRKPAIERPAVIAQLADLPLTRAVSTVKALIVTEVERLVTAARWPGASLPSRAAR